MKVLHVLDHSLPLHSGYSFRTRAIVEVQRRYGWQTIHVTSPRQGPVTAWEEEVEGLSFFRTPDRPGVAARLPVARHFADIRALSARLERIIADTDPDVIHAHSPALVGMAALRAARRSGKPLVYEVRAFWEDAATDHGTCRQGDLRYRATRMLETHVLRRADAVTTICEGLRADIVQRGVEPQRVTVIPNAVDSDRFNVGGEANAGLARGLGLAEKKVIGFIGSFYAYEGLDLLLEALASLSERVPETRVLLVGGGPEEGRLKALASALGVEGKVVFTGRVPHEDVQQYYDLIDVFAYPRRPMRLTELVTPLKPLEAMAQGRLVVASDVGGHRELIQDGVTGTLFPADDPKALATSLAELLHTPRAGEAMRQSAREFVQHERTWPASVARYEGVYRGLLTDRT